MKKKNKCKKADDPMKEYRACLESLKEIQKTCEAIMKMVMFIEVGRIVMPGVSEAVQASLKHKRKYHKRADKHNPTGAVKKDEGWEKRK